MRFCSASFVQSTANNRFFGMKFAPSNAFRCSTTGKTAISWFVAISGRTLGAEREQTPLGNHQVRQAEQR